MMMTTARRMVTTAVLRVPVGEPSFLLQAITKSPGQAVSFGETIALVKAQRSDAAAVPLTAPVHGEIVKFTAKVGDSIRSNAELAIFESRRPLIEFRHLKGPFARPSTTISVSQPNPASSSASQSSPKPAAPTASSTLPPGLRPTVETKSFLDLPPYFGRLPPFSPKEMSYINSGGAADLWEDPAADPKGGKGGKKPK